MKNFILFLALMFCLSCNSDCSECVVCESDGESLGVNLELDGILFWFVPNIIVTDFPDDNYLGLDIELRDTTTLVQNTFPPDSISVKIFDSSEKLIYQLDHVIQDTTTGYIFLWDGFYDNNEYFGQFSYELYMGFEQDQFIHYRGISFATTCEALNNCADPDVECDLENCRWFPWDTQESSFPICG